MKMTKEDYDFILTVFKDNKEKVIAHFNHIKTTGKFQNLYTRVAWDCIHRFIGTDFVIGQYQKGLADSHVTTASVKALKTLLKDEGIE